MSDPLISTQLVKTLLAKCENFTAADFVRMIDNMDGASVLLEIKFEEKFPAEAAAWKAENYPETPEPKE